MLVAGARAIARQLTFLGLDTILPTFPSEAVARLALRGGGPAPLAPEGWEAVRSQVAALIHTVKEMPLPQDDPPGVSHSAGAAYSRDDRAS
jgi:hypothetical protein